MLMEINAFCLKESTKKEKKKENVDSETLVYDI